MSGDFRDCVLKYWRRTECKECFYYGSHMYIQHNNLDEISCDEKTSTADCWEKSYLTINQIVAFSSCDQNWPIRGMLISNQNRNKALMHMLQSSERFVDGFHFLAKFIIQFICKRKAYTICVLSVLHKILLCSLFFCFDSSVPKSIKIYLAKGYSFWSVGSAFYVWAF